MIFVILFGWLTVGLVAGFLLMKPKAPKPTASLPPTVPITEVGKTIPWLFGTGLITPSIATWGDVKILKIKVDTAGKK